MNDFLHKLNLYCEAHTTAQPAILHQLERETHLKTLAPQMLSGHLQGQFLAMLSKICRPRAILEIGAFTGYSAICLAQGLEEGGVLHTIEANPELEYLIRKYIALAGLEGSIRLHIGDAPEIIPGLKGPFDLVFIDANKQEYALYYDLVIDKVQSGGLIIADNVLWSGIVKSFVFGVAVSLIAVFEGYDAVPTAEGVSSSIKSTVVQSALAILALDFVLTSFMFREA